MSRKAESNTQQLDDEVIRCYIDDHGREVTTIAERQEIAALWCQGNYVHHHSIAAERRLLPIALLIASLIEIDHPLIVSPSRGVMYSSMGCATLILETMLKNESVSEPISFHKLPVERIVQP